MTISPDTDTPDDMNEQRDDIEDSLDDLLIFPTRQGLRRSIDTMKSYFAKEIEFMKQQNNSSSKISQSQSIIESHEAVLKIGMKELNNRTQNVATSSSCESCWIQAPKSIDKGIDKNVAARLAAAFAKHTELFDSIICNDDGGE